MKYLIIALALTLTACGPDPDLSKVRNSSFASAVKKDPRTSDCIAVALVNEYGSEMTMIRCPNSTVATKTNSKSPVTTVVIDGVTYAPMFAPTQVPQ